VVGDTRNQGLQSAPAPEAFIPYTVTGMSGRAIMIRSITDSDLVLSSLRQALAEVDPSVALSAAEPVENVLHRQVAAPEFGLMLLTIFASVGLILSSIGIFSVTAYSVSIKTHDIGIRMALGAKAADILSMVIKAAMKPIIVGILFGIPTSYFLARLMISQLWGVSAADPWTFAGVTALTVLFGVAASLFPARCAAKVDPLVALRGD